MGGRPVVRRRRRRLGGWAPSPARGLSAPDAHRIASTARPVGPTLMFSENSPDSDCGGGGGGAPPPRRRLRRLITLSSSAWLNGGFRPPDRSRHWFNRGRDREESVKR